MIGTKGRVALTALCVLTLDAGAARAQHWGSTGYGVAEVDTKQTALLLAGLSATPGGRGWAPLLSLQAYYLTYKVGDSHTNEVVFTPAAGLRNGFDDGEFVVTAGYAFSNRDNNVAAPVVAATRGSGFVLSADLTLAPRTSAWDFQGLSSYNFGSESFWGRVRTTTRLGSGPGTATRIGPELAYLTGSGYWAWQPGLVLTWTTAAGQSVGVGAGAKIVNGTDNNAAYFRFEFGVPLFR